MNALQRRMAQRLAAIRENNRWRFRRPIEGQHGVYLNIEGERLLGFCSNDYLGLATHSAVQQAAADAGPGSTGSALITGHNRLHAELENRVAEYLGQERALLFSSGFAANVGVIDALVGKGDQVFSDALNHASLIDGCRLSGATVHRYPHADMPALRAQLASTKNGASPETTRLIVSDGLFSMDGDIAPLAELVSAARQNDAALYIDDAHGFGVLGRELDGQITGEGSPAATEVAPEELDVQVITLGKSLGCAGALVLGSNDLVEYLLQVARSHMFSTALPPSIAAAGLAAFDLLKTEHWRREKLRNLIQYFRQGAANRGMELGNSQTPIQPVMAGSEANVLAWSAALRERGILVVAIRPPTVPAGTCRLRVTFTANHSEAQVDELLDALEATRPLVENTDLVVNS